MVLLTRLAALAILNTLQARPLQEALQVSKEDAVTVIVNVIWDDATSTLYAEHDIIDKKFEAVLCGPIYAVSPSIWNHNPKEDIVTDYEPVHLAFLDIDGAYGPSSEELEKSCVCKTNKQDTCNSNMDPEKKEPEEKQEMSSEEMTKQMYAMMKENARVYEKGNGQRRAGREAKRCT